MAYKILLELRHPAHVHHFKHFIWEMQEKGHEVKICAIDKEITKYLLDIYGFEYNLIGRNMPGLLNKAFDLIKTDKKVYYIAKQFKPDIFVGRASPSLAHVSAIMKKPYISFSDTEHAKLIFLVTKPFMTNILTPSCFKKDFGKKQIRYDGYHELAYLHPKYFTPNPLILDELGIMKNEKFFILRFISWQASHDLGQKGFNLEEKKNLVDELEKFGRVLITSESGLPQEFEKNRITLPPEKIHDLLYYASMYVGEGGTMATEAAVLGTPSVRVSTIAKHMGVFNELTNKYQLLHFFDRPQDGLKKAKELLNSNSKVLWQKRRKKLLEDKIDVTKFMTWFIEEYPESENIMRQNPDFQKKFK